MRQLQVLHKARCFDVVRMGQHKLFVLRRSHTGLAQLIGTQCAVHQGHGHGLALGAAKGQPIALGELRRYVFAAMELVDHLAFGHFQVANIDRKTEFIGLQFHTDKTTANLTGKWVGVGVAALGGVTHGQQPAFVTPGQSLQAQRAVGGEHQGVAGQVTRCCGIHWLGCLQQAFAGQEIIDAGHHGVVVHRRDLVRLRGVYCRCLLDAAFGQQPEVQQALGVVVGGPQQLAPWHLFESGRYASHQVNTGRVQRHRVAQPWQRSAVGAQQKNGFHQVATGLLDGQGRKLGVKQGPFTHHPVHRQRKLRADLRNRQLGDARVTTPLRVEQTPGTFYGGCTALDCYIHIRPFPIGERVWCGAGPAHGRHR